MLDERQATYHRLIAGLLQLPAHQIPTKGTVVSVQDVVGMLAEEFLGERHGNVLPLGNGLAYRLDEGEGGTTTITCQRCGMTSHHPDDVANLYCGNCKQFHA